MFKRQGGCAQAPSCVHRPGRALENWRITLAVSLAATALVLLTINLRDLINR
jgi:hypothetical protein